MQFLWRNELRLFRDKNYRAPSRILCGVAGTGTGTPVLHIVRCGSMTSCTSSHLCDGVFLPALALGDPIHDQERRYRLCDRHKGRD